MIKEILSSKNGVHISSGKFNISKVGMCRRRVYLELKGEYKEEYSPELLRIFQLGDIFHRGIVNELISKGHQTGVHITATEIAVGNEMISGRIDALVSDGIKNYVMDIKSTGKWSLDKLEKGEISEDYINQIMLYMWFSGIHNGILLFVGKEKGQIVEIPVEYDENKAIQLIEEIQDFMIKNVQAGIEPDRCDGGRWGCDCCK